MKKRIVFALIMGLITTTLISFILIAVNVGFTSKFVIIWLRSWFLSYIIVVFAMLFVAPKLQLFIETLNRNSNRKQGKVFPIDVSYRDHTRPNNNNHKKVNMSQINTEKVTQNEIKAEKAIFSSGCFWGTEYYFQKAEGVISTAVGYTGGSTVNPTYEQVSTGRAGHAEAIEVIYDPKKTTYENMVKLFYETHDQSQKNRQGPDIGTQYRSGIFYINNEQKEIAERLTQVLINKGYKVATEITKAGIFYKAENYHQNYYGKNGQNPYCHRYIKKF